VCPEGEEENSSIKGEGRGVIRRRTGSLRSVVGNMWTLFYYPGKRRKRGGYSKYWRKGKFEDIVVLGHWG